MVAPAAARTHNKILNSTMLVVGLGYCIDAFDVFLYNALRIPSLRDLGLEGDALVKTGLNILSLQVIGMLIGGLLWGVLGDKIGRKKALLGSVLLYSLGALGCAFTSTVGVYAFLRFLTGIGLAGEIGLGAILIAETLPDDKRHWSIAIYTLFAYLGIALVSLLAGHLPWRICYAIGGIAGLVLLLARMALFESGLYEELVARTEVARGSLKLLLTNPALVKRWLCCIFFMMPYFYVFNVLITLAPEFGKAAGATTPIKADVALVIYSVCGMIGTIASVLISQVLRKRIMAILLFMAANLVLSASYLLQSHANAFDFYVVCGIMGSTNYFALLLFAAIEQFGTNMRSTLGVSAISAGRTTLVITNSVFLALRGAGLDITTAAAWVGALVFSVGFLCLFGLRETYHHGIDFLEEPIK